MVETGAWGDEEDSGAKRERKSDERPAWIVPVVGGAVFGRPITKTLLSESQAVQGLVPVVDICRTN